MNERYVRHAHNAYREAAAIQPEPPADIIDAESWPVDKSQLWIATEDQAPLTSPWLVLLLAVGGALVVWAVLWFVMLPLVASAPWGGK